MKKSLFLLIALTFTSRLFAQQLSSRESAFVDDPFNHPLMPIYFITALTIIVIVLLIVVSVYMLKVLNMVTRQTEKEKALKLGVAYAPSPGWWERFTQQMNASVPLEKEKDIELDHSYDGIKELDNYLPPWWKWLFYGTIAWAAIYVVVFHFSNSLPLSIEEYQNELALAEEQAIKLKAAKPQTTIDESTLQFTRDEAVINKGKSVFVTNNCGSCHRNDGGGNAIGPNLTDEFWLHGGDVKNIFVTIRNGVVEKGMPAWGKAMSPENVRDVTFYVMSLQGTNPPAAKAGQGELFKKISEKTDSTRSQAAL